MRPAEVARGDVRVLGWLVGNQGKTGAVTLTTRTTNEAFVSDNLKMKDVSVVQVRTNTYIGSQAVWYSRLFFLTDGLYICQKVKLKSILGLG